MLYHHCRRDKGLLFSLFCEQAQGVRPAGDPSQSDPAEQQPEEERAFVPISATRYRRSADHVFVLPLKRLFQECDTAQVQHDVLQVTGVASRWGGTTDQTCRKHRSQASTESWRIGSEPPEIVLVLWKNPLFDRFLRNAQS